MVSFIRIASITYLATLTISINIQAQEKVQYPVKDSTTAYMKKIFDLIKENSIYRKDVKWDAIEDSVNRKMRGVKAIDEMIPIITYIFESIHDYHGGLLYEKKRYRATLPAVLQAKKVARPDLTHAIETQKAKIDAIVLDKKYGYIMFPKIDALNSDDIDRYTTQIVDAIATLPSDLKGYIIDLRLCTGGSVPPMMNGIGRIIGNGIVGSSVNADGQVTYWVIKDGKYSRMNGNKMSEDSNNVSVKKFSKVAVLISPLTASAGEAVAIAFKGRPKTKFFGESSAGFPTGNKVFDMDGGLRLIIAQVYAADRKGNKYFDFVDPDEILTGGDNFDDPRKDLKVQEALKWLRRKD